MVDMTAQASADYWSTSITRIRPSEIAIRGYPIEELIGAITLPDMIHLMLVGELPNPARRALLEAALVSAVDHGPQAPSIATARMAATCGADYNSIIAAAVSLLGDVHGGAGQQCMEMLYAIVTAAEGTGGLESATRRYIDDARTSGPIPGFGHRYHPVDPRATRLRAMIDSARINGVVSGHYLDAATEIERQLAQGRERTIPMNIDGATAVTYAELGFGPPLGRALFVLSRSVGIIAHAWEEMQSGTRLKGPMPPAVIPHYNGPAIRHLDQ